MRLLALTLALATLAACLLAAIPGIPVVRAGPEASTSALLTVDGDADDDGQAPVDASAHDDSESGTEDAADDSDLELVAVLPGALTPAIMLGSAQRWTSTHARPNEDPDPTFRHRPPIAA